MKRPERKDYFEYRGNTLIMIYGHAENFMDAQDDYIDYLEDQIKALKSNSLPCVNEWISVSERKPDKVGKYLVYRLGCNKTHFATWNGSMFAYNPDVTHWAILNTPLS